MRAPRPRVTQAQVDGMRRMRTAGYLPEDIAAEFGVHARTVTRYTRGLQPRVRSGRFPYAVGPHQGGTARQEEFGRRLAAGETLACIGASQRPPISGERVRQIVAAYERRTGTIVPRIREQGIPKEPPPAPVSDEEFLLARSVDRGACRVWTGPTLPNGYPTLGGKSTRRGEQYAHRLAYRTWVGEVPQGVSHLVVKRSCRNKLCIRPDHLYLGPPGRTGGGA